MDEEYDVIVLGQASKNASSVASVDGLKGMNSCGDLDVDALSNALSRCANIPKEEDNDDGCGLQITCFTDVVDDLTLHFQIIRLPKQIYAWVGCNSTKFGHLYAAASTRPNNMVSVTSILGGASDNTGSGIARRLALKTGLNIILACNIPKNNPMLEANAEEKLIKKLINLGYTRPKPEGSRGL